jgi:1-deoxy-D-xylulose-5-phosphate reductoisomerase
MKILLLGSTGSIGSSACNCIRRFKDMFELAGISANNNIELLAEQVNEFNVSSVCICSPQAAQKAHSLLPSSCRIFEGRNSLVDLIKETDFDMMVNALVGAVGFRPTYSALKRNKKVALANKESLVIGGDLISKLLEDGYGTLIPVDSEHSAILQCLNGEESKTIENITITASGGPFRELPIEQFKDITVKEALNHPTWSMGKKITIDSSTLINKGFEAIEAHHLFRMPYQKLNILIHPQSIIHSMVTFHDGAVMAQCGVPDMELPIQYALGYPKRLPLNNMRLDLTQIGSLTFEKPDFNRFPCIKLCLDTGSEGGTLPTVLNAANEIAVQLFLEGKIGYNQISEIIEKALNSHNSERIEAVEQIEEVDENTRQNILGKIKSG